MLLAGAMLRLPGRSIATCELVLSIPAHVGSLRMLELSMLVPFPPSCRTRTAMCQFQLSLHGLLTYLLPAVHCPMTS